LENVAGMADREGDVALAAEVRSGWKCIGAAWRSWREARGGSERAVRRDVHAGV